MSEDWPPLGKMERPLRPPPFTLQSPPPPMDEDGEQYVNETLRDRFAMVAADMFVEETVRAADRKGALKQLAKTAYFFADAMMEARK